VEYHIQVVTRSHENEEVYGQRLRPAPAVDEIFLLGEKGDRKDHVERIWPACESFTPAAPSCFIGSTLETNFMTIEVVDIIPQEY
jgi:hypothetical protein